MLRLIFVLLIVFGLASVGYGTYQMFGNTPDRRSVSSVDMSSSAENDIGQSEEAAPQAALPDFTPSMQESSETVFARSASDFLSTLREVPLAHETPKSAQFGRAFEVTLAVDGTGGDSAAGALPGEGNVVESIAMISADVQATLSGDAFEIEAMTPLVQSISPLTENVWRWNAVPLEAGTQNLTLEVFALNEDRALPIRTFRDNIEVRVSPIGQAIALADALSPIAVVVGGVGSLIAGLLGIFRFFRER
ncbi:MAG: hypothetical protein AAGJ84_10920 [Pseudomonadota bacterium]